VFCLLVLQAEDAEANMKRLLANKFDFNDFLAQYKTMNNMGGAQIMKLMPGMSKVCVCAHACTFTCMWHI